MNLLDTLHSNPAFFVFCMTLLGLAVGSFLNVVIHRLPIMLEREWQAQCAELNGDDSVTPTPMARYDLWQPRSQCPHCGHAITALENIPLLSYLVLRGRCRGCGNRISARYPVVEALGGLTAAVAAWHFGFDPQALGAALLGWSLIALSLIDFDKQLLPDIITLPFLWVGLALNLGHVFTDLHSAVIGAMAGYLSLWSVFWLFKLATGKEGMGYGDFKLLALLGAWMGWQQLPVIILLSSVVGAATGIGLIVLRGRDRSIPIPFGPYLACAGWIALMWGDVIVRLYWQWTMPYTP
jgi:leader peptidase (prepilin peptidase)/N-methyltransferase